MVVVAAEESPVMRGFRFRVRVLRGRTEVDKRREER